MREPVPSDGDPSRPVVTAGAPLRVLVPYILTHGGGVRTVLRAGLPSLAAIPELRLTYAELCCNEADMDEMERSGVGVDRDSGVPGPGALSRGAGLRRFVDLARQTVRLSRVARRLAVRLTGYDVVYVHGHRELLLAIAARRFSRIAAPPPIVWHWHGPPLSLSTSGARGSWAGRRIARAGSRACARVIAISDFCARQTRAMGMDPQRVVTVVNAASATQRTAATQPLPVRRPGAFVSLVACASLRRHKGVHLAVAALGHLPAHHVLWVTGDPSDPGARPYLAELEAEAARTGVSDRVTFLGARRDIHRVMALADAVLVPSTWEEPFGLVAAEAQLVGVPVVVSRRGALPEIVRGGELGLVFDPADAKGLAACVARLASSDERHRLADAARRHATEHYGYDRWARQVSAVLRSACSD